ncbi:MAG: Gfo/Idh/MocA family oxidoreductase, partial [Alphaproteobacteria bacterium]
TMLLDHDNGAHSIVDVSYASRLATESFPETLVELDGTHGSIRLGRNYRLEVTTGEGTNVTDVAPKFLPWASRPWHNIQESVDAIQRHWIESLTQGTQPSTSGADNLKTLALVEAAYESAATGKTVEIATLLQ